MQRMRSITVLCIACMFTGMAAAQAADLDKGPGVLGPESPLYGLEKAWDNAAVEMGLKRAGDVAQERAAEAREMVEKGKPAKAADAAEDVRNIADKATSRDQDGIKKAMSAMQQTMSTMQERLQNAPNEQARKGMQTAMDNMQNALDNMKNTQEKIDQAMQQSSGDTQQDSGDEQQSGSGGRVPAWDMP